MDGFGGAEDRGLSEQIRELGEKIQSLALAVESADIALSKQDHGHLPTRIRDILKLRDSRRAIFADTLFGEPAWDMLLELYAAEISGRTESVSSLCIGLRVPATTALRWIVILESGGWAERRPDSKDGRRIFIKLTSKGRDAMQRFFAQPEIALGT